MASMGGTDGQGKTRLSRARPDGNSDDAAAAERGPRRHGLESVARQGHRHWSRPALQLAATPREVAANADIIFMCLLDASAVEEVVFGPDGLASADGAGKLVVDFSSIHPDAARSIATRLKQANGMGWIDAPVSGGTKGAEEGTLAVMAGGDAADIERVRPYVLAMARRLTHMGPTGAGQTTKLCNQIISGCSHGGAGGGDAARGQCRHRRLKTAGSAGRRLCRFHPAAIVRAAHGAGHSLAAARPYRDHPEGPRYGGRGGARHLDAGADDGAGRAIVPDGKAARGADADALEIYKLSEKRKD